MSGIGWAMPLDSIEMAVHDEDDGEGEYGYGGDDGEFGDTADLFYGAEEDEEMANATVQSRSPVQQTAESVLEGEAYEEDELKGSLSEKSGKNVASTNHVELSAELQPGKKASSEMSSLKQSLEDPLELSLLGDNGDGAMIHGATIVAERPALAGRALIARGRGLAERQSCMDNEMTTESFICVSRGGMKVRESSGSMYMPNSDDRSVYTAMEEGEELKVSLWPLNRSDLICPLQLFLFFLSIISSAGGWHVMRRSILDSRTFFDAKKAFL